MIHPIRTARARLRARFPRPTVMSQEQRTALVIAVRKAVIVVYLWMFVLSVILLFEVAHGISQRRDLARIQQTIIASQKASTETRVKTVSQRCELTHLLVAVLMRQDPVELTAFQRSYDTCLRQLALVKRIDTQTPDTRSGLRR